MTTPKKPTTVEDEKTRESIELDHELEDSFPASDPPSIVTPHPHPPPLKPTK